MGDRVRVIGGGGWGTAIAVHLARKGTPVLLWVREPDLAQAMDRDRVNDRFLPGVGIPPSVTITASLEEASRGSSSMTVLAVPTHGLREVAGAMRTWWTPGAPVVSVAKGFEVESGLRPSEVIAQSLGVPPRDLFVLSGPSHAEEVGRELPTAVVVAGEDPARAVAVQQVFFSPRFRVYSHSDPLGVEIAGALKNVMAIACGISDGLGFGDNTRAALVTRGLAEMTRLGVTLGARRETFMGLAGLGDLIVTCTSELSRNHRVGMRLGRGESPEAILEGMQQVAEGVRAAKVAWRLACERAVSMPITEQVHEVLFGNSPAAEALENLLGRGMRSEEEGPGNPSA